MVTLFMIVGELLIDGDWAAVLISVGIGTVCKWVFRDSEENKPRVYREAEPQFEGYSKEDAAESLISMVRWLPPY